MRQSGDLQSLSAISYSIVETSETQIEERPGVESLAAVIMIFIAIALNSMRH